MEKLNKVREVLNSPVFKPYWEGFKKGARVAVSAMVLVLIDGLNKGYIDWELVVASGATAMLIWLDGTLHEIGKVKGNETLTKGLTRF